MGVLSSRRCLTCSTTRSSYQCSYALPVPTPVPASAPTHLASLGGGSDTGRSDVPGATRGEEAVARDHDHVPEDVAPGAGGGSDSGTGRDRQQPVALSRCLQASQDPVCSEEEYCPMCNTICRFVACVWGGGMCCAVKESARTPPPLSPCPRPSTCLAVARVVDQVPVQAWGGRGQGGGGRDIMVHTVRVVAVHAHSTHIART